MTQQPPRALVLEDEPLLNRMFGQVLRQLSLDVFQAQTLAHAEALLRQHRPFQLVLADMQLPDGVSLTLLQRLAQQLREDGTQVIILTAEPRFRDLAEQMGFEYYLEKPVSLEMLRHFVARVLNLPFSRRESEP